MLLALKILKCEHILNSGYRLEIFWSTFPFQTLQQRFSTDRFVEDFPRPQCVRKCCILDWTPRPQCTLYIRRSEVAENWLELSFSLTFVEHLNLLRASNMSCKLDIWNCSQFFRCPGNSVPSSSTTYPWSMVTAILSFLHNMTRHLRHLITFDDWKWQTPWPPSSPSPHYYHYYHHLHQHRPTNSTTDSTNTANNTNT